MVVELFLKPSKCRGKKWGRFRKIMKCHERSWNAMKYHILQGYGLMEREYKNSLPLWKGNLGSTWHQMAGFQLPDFGSDRCSTTLVSTCPVKWAILLGWWAHGVMTNCWSLLLVPPVLHLSYPWSSHGYVVPSNSWTYPLRLDLLWHLVWKPKSHLERLSKVAPSTIYKHKVE